MKTITSVSGGRTSSYMAVHYPTDLYCFAVVLTDDPEAVPRDPGLLRECQERIPWFRGSRELDQTLLAVLRLEQEIGKRIDWVASELTYDQAIEERNLLPTRLTRFCTKELKIKPIFEYWFRHCAPEPCLMNIGFRWDEYLRVEKWDCSQDKYKYASHCDLKTQHKKWVTVEWRVANFPLYTDKIDRITIEKYWSDRGWDFPKVSNCDFCFFHRPKEHKLQASLYPERAKWWMSFEERYNATFGNKPLSDILVENDEISQVDERSCFCSD